VSAGARHAALAGAGSSPPPHPIATAQRRAGAIAGIFTVRMGSPYDREIIGLAVPALGALAAEPLYLLADTAIVGHLGTTELAALALAATVLTTLVSLCIPLTYGTTAQVARLHGAGEHARAGALAAQALWLALGIGAALLVTVVALAGPVVGLLGEDEPVEALAARYARIAALGVPFALVALAGTGFLRGIGDLRTPLVVVVAGNALNVVLDVVLVYGFGLGLDGSAIGTAIGQAAMGAAFVVLLLRAGARAGAPARPRPALVRGLVGTSGWLFVRTAALLASFVTASAVLARVGAPSLAAHQIAFQLFVALALVLDAVAIAGQVIVGRTLGAGDRARAVAAARRIVVLGLYTGALLAAVLLALRGVVPGLFTDDGAVLERLGAMWWLLALMQPVAAIAFALDGVLIGAGDARFLAGSMLASALGVYVPVALAALAFGWGIVGVWCGVVGLMAARAVSLGWRLSSGRWAVVGVGNGRMAE
jgi:putative MATE family efflux protein